MKKVLSIFALLLLSISATYSQQINDSSLVKLHRFDREIYNKLKAKNQYQDPDKKVLSFFEQIMQWILDFLQKLLPDFNIKPMNNTNTDAILWVIVAVFIAFIIFLLFKLKFHGLFKRKPVKVRSEEFELLEENIHEIAFVTEIQTAENEGNFRKAIRLHYLNTLKHLDDNNYIKWTPNNTNSDFKKMMKNNKYTSEFNTLLWIYEYVWYGLSNPTNDEYTKLKKSFQEFQMPLNTLKA